MKKLFGGTTKTNELFHNLNTAKCRRLVW